MMNANDVTMSSYGRLLPIASTACQSLQLLMRKSSAVTED